MEEMTWYERMEQYERRPELLKEREEKNSEIDELIQGYVERELNRTRIHLVKK